MTTLESIGFTLAGGSCVMVASVAVFGLAVQRRSTNIAPRATARPRNVIYNPSPDLESQNTGNPFFGWIPWVLGFTYDELLTGIPGTGTRENGKSGSLLKVNLDGIILLRFHMLGFKVAALAAALLLAIALPSYLSAQCYNRHDLTTAGCGENTYNLTNYQRTTIANVPNLVNVSPEDAVFESHNGVLWRLYTVVLCFWIIAKYLCSLLKNEWIQIIAIRRVYYLEYDVWGERRKELKQTLLYEEIAKQKREAMANDQNDIEKQQPNNQVDNTDDERDYLHNRDPWIPHPEQRDTVPNVALYSVLVGGLPSLPEQAADSFNTDATIQFSKRESIDWQLSVATTFFDHCVPNQPGFSSSVAAITILPSAHDLSLAWIKWYAAASKLRRLRFVRKQIATRRNFEISSDEKNDNNALGHTGDATDYGYGDTGNKIDYGYGDQSKNIDYGYGAQGDGTDYGYGDPDSDEVFVPADTPESEYEKYILPPPKKFQEERDSTPRGIYEAPSQNKEYYRKVLGSALGNEHDTHIYDSLDFGPEQAAVYAREFAQAAAPPCPNGCFEGRVTNATLQQLEEMERVLAIEVHQANVELRQARTRATKNADLGKTNIHDQQTKNVSAKMAHARKTTICAQTTAAPCSDTLDPRKTSECDNGTVETMAHQPLVSRYERRISNMDENIQKEQPPSQRLNPNLIADLAGSHHDLGLEAQLFQKSRNAPSRSQSREDLDALSSRNGRSPPSKTLSSEEIESQPVRKGKKQPFSRSHSMDLEVQCVRTGIVETSRYELESQSLHSGRKICRQVRCQSMNMDTQASDGVEVNNPCQQHEDGQKRAGYNTGQQYLSHQKSTPSNATVPKPPTIAARSKTTGDTPVSQKFKMPKRDIPTLDGIILPESLKLEAKLTQDFSERSSSTVRARQQLNDQARYRKQKDEPSSKEPSSSYDASYSTSNADSDSIVHELEAAMQSPVKKIHHQENHIECSTSTNWVQCETMIMEAFESERTGRSSSTPTHVATGKWKWPTLNEFFTRSTTENVKKWAKNQSKEVLNTMARESTYAVVTFTSRQAAVAARHCLADGRGSARWITMQDIPIPPLADAAPGDLMNFRNCCRPVTVSINDRQKNCRNYIALVLLFMIYVFYTIPLTLASQLAEPKNLENLFPRVMELAAENGVKVTLLVSGLITAFIWSSFFALCPLMFTSIANFGSNAPSVAGCEMRALQYYWWFMICTAFSGQLLAQMTINAWNTGLELGNQLSDFLRNIAAAIPSTLSVSWLNWIIYRFTITLPMFYLVQFNAFCFGALCLPWLSRLQLGGGPGGPVPYRIYVDSGVVMLCLLALAPASPIMAPACCVYFLFCQPLLRRNLIFMYRPKFDGGGFRWPFMFDMCISSLVYGAILLTVQMVLKGAVGPAVGAAFTIIPVVLFSKNMKQRFMKSFMDAALLQTSLLDGWDACEDYTFAKREEFRQFLVDAHKAAYVPICLAGTDTDGFLTAEPAVVVPTSWEEEQVEEIVKQERSIQEQSRSIPTDPQTEVPSELPQSSEITTETQSLLAYAEKRKTQHGVTIRRAAPNLLASRRRGSTFGTTLLETLNERKSLGHGCLDHSSEGLREESHELPFERSSSVRNIESKRSFQKSSLTNIGMSWSTRSTPSLRLMTSTGDSSSMAKLVAEIADSLYHENSLNSKSEDKTK